MGHKYTPNCATKDQWAWQELPTLDTSKTPD